MTTPLPNVVRRMRSLAQLQSGQPLAERFERLHLSRVIHQRTSKRSRTSPRTGTSSASIVTSCCPPRSARPYAATWLQVAGKRPSRSPWSMLPEMLTTRYTYFSTPRPPGSPRRTLQKCAALIWARRPPTHLRAKKANRVMGLLIAWACRSDARKRKRDQRNAGESPAGGKSVAGRCVAVPIQFRLSSRSSLRR
jgi:hypothetical protein